MWRVGLIVLAGLAIVCGFGGYFGTQVAEKVAEGREPQAKQVLIDRVARADLTRSVSAPGAIEPLRIVQISAQVQARVVELPFEEGDFVEEGQIVVRLDDEDIQARMRSAQARLLGAQAAEQRSQIAVETAKSSQQSDQAQFESAQARLREAAIELERSMSLVETKDVAQSELDSAQAAFDQAQAGVASARAALAIAEQSIRRAEADLTQARANVLDAEAFVAQIEKDIDNTVIRSPISGTVTTLNAEVGELVVVGILNNPSTVILEIADLSKMLLRARVDEQGVAFVEVGQPAEILVNADTSKPLTGTVEFVGLQLKQWRDGTNYFDAEILVDPAALLADDAVELRSGLNATARIDVEPVENVLRVPSQAVLSRRIDELPRELRSSELVNPERTFAQVVYLKDGNTAKATPVSVGISDLASTTILAGLGEGDEVIVGPFRLLDGLRDGDDIRLQDDEDDEPAVAQSEQSAEQPNAEEQVSGGA